jgi:hypothetical protein
MVDPLVMEGWWAMVAGRECIHKPLNAFGKFGKLLV